MKKEIMILVIFFIFVGGCSISAPYFSEVKPYKDYFTYNETVVINYEIINPTKTTLNAKIQILAYQEEGFFNCFNSYSNNLGYILPTIDNPYKGQINITSLNKDNCKDKQFKIVISLQDENTGNEITKENKNIKILNI